jgi:hypothetical protein
MYEYARATDDTSSRSSPIVRAAPLSSATV